MTGYIENEENQINFKCDASTLIRVLTSYLDVATYEEIAEVRTIIINIIDNKLLILR
jgi:hypothetical protein